MRGSFCWFEVVGEFGAVGGVVEEGIDVVQDVPFGDFGVVVVGAELVNAPTQCVWRS